MSYSQDQFYLEYVTGTGVGRARAVAKLAASIGLALGHDTSVRIQVPWKRWDDKPQHSIQFETDMKLLSRIKQQKLKRFVKLEVPGYALGGTYESPPLHGHLEVRGAANDIIELDFTCNGAYICIAKGEVEKEPSEWEQRQAGKLAAMTPEEILADHQKRIAALQAPKKVASFECKPAGAAAEAD